MRAEGRLEGAPERTAVDPHHIHVPGSPRAGVAVPPGVDGARLLADGGQLRLAQVGGGLGGVRADPDPVAEDAGPDDAAGTDDDYTNLVKKFLGTFAYSFVFDGQAGYLDHALSSAGMTSQVTGVTEWHNNADEADVLDYDTSFKPPAQDALYEDAPYRSSDHDSISVGLDLDAPPVITSLTGPTEPVKVGTSQTFTAAFTDVNSDDTHEVTWQWGDGTDGTKYSVPSNAGLGWTFHQLSHRVQSDGAVGNNPTAEQAHAEVDRRMVRNVHEQDLRGADQQRGLDARRIDGESALEEFAHDVAQRAEAAQRGRGEHAGEGAVAVGERGQARMPFKLQIERAPAAQHAVDYIGGDAAGGKTGHFRWRCTSCCRCHEVP